MVSRLILIITFLPKLLTVAFAYFVKNILLKINFLQIISFQTILITNFNLSTKNKKQFYFFKIQLTIPKAFFMSVFFILFKLTFLLFCFFKPPKKKIFHFPVKKPPPIQKHYQKQSFFGIIKVKCLKKIK